MAAKKRFTFADAKEKIKELESKIESLNVDLSDNVVTSQELITLRKYKIWLVISLLVNLTAFISLLF